MSSKEMPKSYAGLSNYVVSSSSESDDETKKDQQPVSKSARLENTTADSKPKIPEKIDSNSSERADPRIVSNFEQKAAESRKTGGSKSRSPLNKKRDDQHDHRNRNHNDGNRSADRGNRNRDDYNLGKRNDYDRGSNRGYNDRYGKRRHEDRYDDRRRDRDQRDDRDDRYQKTQSWQSKIPMAERAKQNFEKKASKLIEQVERRKMLFQQGNKEKKVANHWESMLATCTDEKQAEKLKKLIGMKEGETSASCHHDDVVEEAEKPSGEAAEKAKTATGKNVANLSEEARRKQAELFENLNQQYETARMTTHSHRGVGLGFSSQAHHEYNA